MNFLIFTLKYLTKLMTKDLNIDKLMYETASKSTFAHKYACIIVHRNKIIATGYNRFTSKLYISGCCLLCS